MALAELQNTAIDKLQARRQFELDGLATIKVRAPTQSAAGTRLVTVKASLASTGAEFAQLVADTLQLDRQNMKMINAGKFIVDDLTLTQQNIRNNQQIMAIVVANNSQMEASSEAGTSASGESSENLYAKMAKVRADAEMLSHQHFHVN